MRYGDTKLRHRTRDSSWQWLLMGSVLGLGFAMVLCVGGYALGAITFPALEAKTVVKVESNQDEVALQSTALQQTLSAQQVAAAIQPTSTENMAPASTETVTSGTPAADTAVPTLLLDNTQATLLAQTASPTTLPGAAVQPPTQTPPQAAALVQDTPVVGTPPVGAPTQTLAFLTSPAIDPTLAALKTDMSKVDGGTFLMGTTIQEASEAVDQCPLYGKTCDINTTSDSIPSHQITVDSFEMEIYEVSVEQYVAFLNWKGPNSHKTGCLGQPCALTVNEQEFSAIEFDGTTYAVKNPEFYSSHPVAFVTWYGAEAYCEALNRRLPTEAEWERAARGPQNFTYPWGFDFDVNKAMSSALPIEQRGTVAINTYPNGVGPYGTFNMAGNVEEWVSDWYSLSYYSDMATNPVPNPKGPPSGTEKVLRGGSWDTAPLFLRAVHRRSWNPGDTTSSIGFRCASGESPAAVPQVPTNQPGDATGGETAPGGAPTLAPAPTKVAPPVPTPTLSPG